MAYRSGWRTGEDGEPYYQIAVSKQRKLSFLGTPLYTYSPLPLEAVGATTQLAHADFQEDDGLKINSILLHPEGDMDIFTTCFRCRGEFWRPIIVGLPFVCDFCLDEEKMAKAPKLSELEEV